MLVLDFVTKEPQYVTLKCSFSHVGDVVSGGEQGGGLKVLMKK